MTATTDTIPSPLPRSRGSLLFRVVFGLVGLVALFFLGRYGLHSLHYVGTDDAYVTGHLHQVSPQISGQVLEVLVSDNQEVAVGQPLVRIDPLGCQIAVERARAAVAQAVAQEAQVKASGRQVTLQLEEARSRATQSEALGKIALAQFELAQVTHRRNLQLINNGGAATQADLDRSQASLDTYKAAGEAAASNLSTSRSSIQVAEEVIQSSTEQARAAAAALKLAEAGLHEAERQLSFATITAQTAGRIGNKHVETGNLVQPGQALFSIADPMVWVVANLKETQLARMRVGQEAEIRVDAIPDEILKGTVESMSPASGAQFALLPPDNATGNFNKVVQRIPVKITLSPEDCKRLAGRLQQGLSVDVEIRIR